MNGSSKITCTKYMYKINIKQDFLSFTDEIAEPRPDMNIGVAAFIAIKKYNYTLFYMYSSDQLN